MNLCVRSAVRTFGIMMLLSVVAWAPTAFAQADDVATSPDTKPILPVAGTWTGPIDGGQDGIGTLILTISQDMKKLTGAFQTDLIIGQSGPFKGKISGDVVKLNMLDTERVHGCKFKVTATVSGSDMAGVFMVHGGKHCKGRGTIDLTLQP